MRVKVESTGGLAGREVTVALYDTEDMPAEQAKQVEDAVSALGEASADGALGEIGADLPAYRVTVLDVPSAAPTVYEVQGDPSERAGSPLTTLLSGP
ncbi:protealysin inhibitor emfourin [Spirillospora albida]|uniref:protealysin inhibitor emfourin n=1 Tax=Spirillospora albida TaxID=58123 RepID=UPI0004BFF5CE|nr:protealysin inhibitor emfourin [Spirillospora albida]